MRTIVLAILIAAGFVPRAPRLNLDFESGTVGRAPAGWHASASEATLVDQDCPQGRQCAMLSASGAYGTLYDTVATPRRVARKTSRPRTGLALAAVSGAQRVRFRAAVRAEGAGVLMWIRADGPGGEGVYSKSRPITASEWDYYEVEAEVAPDTRQIVFGFLLTGPGKAWIDDAGFVEGKRARTRTAVIMRA